MTEEFLKIVQRDKQIKLTPLGALPKKVIVELYAHRLILEEHIKLGIVKLNREHNSVSIRTVGIVARLAGLIKVQYGRYFLTKVGEKLPLQRMYFNRDAMQDFQSCF